jgi:magnesium transporter
MFKTLAYSPTTGTKEIDISEISDFLNKGAFIWLDIRDPAEKDYEILLDIFNFHPLAIEDCKTKFHLPKINDYDKYIFLIWHAIQDIPATPRIETIEVDIFISRNYLVTLHTKQISHIDEIQNECLKTPDIIKLGLDKLLHNLLDHIVDDYFLIVDRISNQIDALEDQIFKNPAERHVKELFTLKHQMLFIRKLAAPERDVVNMLSRFNSEIVKGRMHIYYQDIYDHLIRILDLIDTSRDVISGAMDIYLSTVSNRLNEVMKKLTIVATIFMPLTLITGIYGMNFRYMPELTIPFFYFGILFLMIIFAVGMFVYFKWKKWW